ncbi:MAG: DNA polymerase III subunit gamma/tau, partial [Chloroflexi bacterium]|nr:DNA polymerase III subunit gamma/tau [Chloroflexota bacterium]
MVGSTGRALYLAWRPRTFDAVVGQRHIVQTLRNAVRNGTLSHAYLFAGPRGTGKTTIARLLFKAANCLHPDDGAPDERCAICQAANEGRAIDLIEMDAASNRGIDDVRDLRDKINYAPAEARYRVYILDEAHQLTQPAWDALLKTLEEPPPHAILVLATTEAHKVPATVLSRCQRFDFHRISAADIRGRLAEIAEREGVDVEPMVLSWLARAARGGLRDAISLLDQLRAFCGDRIDAASARDVLGLAGLETVRPFLDALGEDRVGDALDELNRALEHGVDPRTYVGDSLIYLRGLLLLRYGASAGLRAELPAEELEWLEEHATAWEAPRLRDLVQGFGDALARFRDPAQLLVQIELTLLGGWEAPVDAVPAPPRRTRAQPGRQPADSPTEAPKVEDVVGRVETPRAMDAQPPALPARPPNGMSEAERSSGVGPMPDEVPAGAIAAAMVAPVTAQSTVVSAPPTPLEPRSEQSVDGSALDLGDVRARWPEVQKHLANNRAQFWFHRCELHDVDGSTLIL